MSGWNIFCVEGEWSTDLRDKSSVLPLLNFLHTNDKIKFIYRTAGTEQELRRLVEKWSQKGLSDYRVGYFAGHGKPGQFRVGNDWVDLNTLGEAFPKGLKRKILYFGSCSVLKGDLGEFKRTTGASMLCGYTKNADWMESSAFDLLFLSYMAWYESVSKARKRIEDKAPGLLSSVGFVAQ